MTATLEQHDTAPRSESTETAAALVPASVRVYLLVENQTLIPMVLPAQAPLAKVAAATVKAVQNRLSVGALSSTGVYEFGWIDGAVLSDKPDSTLEIAGVRDGDLLQLVAAGSAVRYVPRNENVASALAAYLRTSVRPVTPATAHVVGVATAVGVAVCCALLIWRTRFMPGSSELVCASALAVLAALAWLATYLTHKRWPELRFAQDASATTGVVLSAACLSALPPKIGTPNLFVAAVTLSVGATVLVVLRQRYWGLAAAVICTGGLVAIAAGVSLFAPLSGLQIGVGALVSALALITVAPALGLWCARIPRQPFRSLRNRDMFDHASGQPRDTLSPELDDTADPSVLSADQVAAAAQRARSALVGICAAVAGIQIVGAWLTITPHTHRPVLGVLLVGAVALELILRARRFNDRVQAVLLVASSIAALVLIGARYAWAAAPDASGVLMYCGWAALPGVLAFVTGTALWRYLFSPNTRKAVEWLGYLLIVLIPLLAAWVLNIFGFLRTQGLHW
ncbi:type VII secretion integral membrane protein EccD [Mycobacterium sp.]|uniref:type VII secretion integral membrane protein EccD n=1 Tax=Mycobacterium sp. TaxID=1785 RepID=UPI003BA9DCD3